jgi:hypothetical protein
MVEWGIEKRADSLVSPYRLRLRFKIKGGMPLAVFIIWPSWGSAFPGVDIVDAK